MAHMPIVPTEQLTALFWANVEPLSESECWIWTGRTSYNGYGLFSNSAAKRQIRANRYAWVLANGRDFAPGMMACHRCDVPSCCNPAHIYEGTRSDNVRDTLKAGTHYPARVSQCKRGHDFSGDNLRFRRDGVRWCKACELIRRNSPEYLDKKRIRNRVAYYASRVSA